MCVTQRMHVYIIWGCAAPCACALGSRDSSVVDQWTHDQKALGLNPDRSG